MSLEQLRISGNLPSPKGVALAVMELCRSDDTTIEDIARIVQRDPALCGRLLRLANAAANGARPVVAVREAVLRLGMRAVRNLATGFSLVDEYRKGACEHFDYQRFWSHSLLMAVAMRELGARTRVALADELFSCGLMARLGRLALATAYPQEYSEILGKQPATDRELVELERKVLSLDHNECTREVLGSFGLPNALVDPIFHHEAPGEAGFPEASRAKQLTSALYFGRRIADLGCGSETERSDIAAELLRLGAAIGLDADTCGAMIDSIMQGWHEWAELLAIPADDLPAFCDLSKASASDDEATGLDDEALRVVLVVSEPAMLQSLTFALEGIGGYQLSAASTRKEAMALSVELMPHVVIIDWRMNGMNGVEFCRALRESRWGRSIYLIMLAPADAGEDVLRAFDSGVDDYLTRPVDPRTLHLRMRAAERYVRLLQAWEHDHEALKRTAAELALSNRKLAHFAHTDILTGLPNRRAAMDGLGQAWSSAERTHEPLVVMMLDIDAFKSFNDTYGHALGDIMLSEVGRVLREASRKEDLVCRFGGEEFIVICRNTDMPAALGLAERLRGLVAGLRVAHGKGQVQTTVSIGLACREASMLCPEDLVDAADKALYAAKHGGRNRICASFQGQVRAAS